MYSASPSATRISAFICASESMTVTSLSVELRITCASACPSAVYVAAILSRSEIIRSYTAVLLSLGRSSLLFSTVIISIPYCAIVAPMLTSIDSASSPSLAFMTSSCVIELIVFLVALKTTVSIRLSAFAIEPLSVCANLSGSVILHST